MFLVADRVDRARQEPLLRGIHDVVIRHPARLRIPHWEIQVAETWLIAGTSQLLASVASVLADWPEYAKDGALAGAAARVTMVAAEEAPNTLGLWTRFKRWLTGDGPVKHETFSQAWLADLAPGEAKEQEVLQRLGRALSGAADVIVLDRVLNLLRPEVRFRVSTELQEICNAEGMTIIALVEAGLEGWIAADRCANVRRGTFELVQRRDLSEI